jgi:hypothetical protein
MAKPEVPASEIPLADIGAFVPFPMALFDEQMPRLKDTEWRLLCVIVRQTLGWKSGKGRKKRDWMSQKQLMTRTGRSSAALSGALDALVRKNLVVCQDKQGKPLLTPQQRRCHRGHVYFALSPPALPNPKPTNMKGRDQPERQHPILLQGRNLFLPRVEAGWVKAGDVEAHHLHPTVCGEEDK